MSEEINTLQAQVADAVQQGLHARAARLLQTITDGPALQATLVRACGLLVERAVERARREGMNNPEGVGAQRGLNEMAAFANAIHGGHVAPLRRERFFAAIEGT